MALIRNNRCENKNGFSIRMKIVLKVGLEFILWVDRVSEIYFQCLFHGLHTFQLHDAKLRFGIIPYALCAISIAELSCHSSHVTCHSPMGLNGVKKSGKTAFMQSI